VRGWVRAWPSARTFESIALGVAVLWIGGCGDTIPDADATDPTVSIRLFDSTQSVLYNADSVSPIFMTADAAFHAELLVSDEGSLQSIRLIGQDAILRSDSTTYRLEHATPSRLAETLTWRGSRDSPTDEINTEVDVAFRPPSTSLLLRFEARDWFANEGTTPSIRVDLMTGGVAGVARDARGDVLPGVTVTITGEALIAAPRVVITDADGTYEFADLPPGTYAVSYHLTGFTRVRRDGVVVEEDNTTRVDVALSAAALDGP